MTLKTICKPHCFLLQTFFVRLFVDAEWSNAASEDDSSEGAGVQQVHARISEKAKKGRSWWLEGNDVGRRDDGGVLHMQENRASERPLPVAQNGKNATDMTTSDMSGKRGISKAR